MQQKMEDKNIHQNTIHKENVGEITFKNTQRGNIKRSYLKHKKKTIEIKIKTISIK